MSKKSKSQKKDKQKVKVNINVNVSPFAGKVIRINRFGQGTMLCPSSIKPDELGDILNLEKISDIEPVGSQFRVTIRKTGEDLGLFETRQEALDREVAFFNKQLKENKGIMELKTITNTDLDLDLDLDPMEELDDELDNDLVQNKL